VFASDGTVSVCESAQLEFAIFISASPPVDWKTTVASGSGLPSKVTMPAAGKVSGRCAVHLSSLDPEQDMVKRGIESSRSGIAE
jgi:hypothetical protein